ncbi:hypothetical protein KSP35_10270 [Aquihabitans sp. G128]|nr:hypothetical protein [Aquihabitans sp. G128]QXC63126.1 hypothetical protein KSP35_10270 [Aquihabitans sp. G128]
MAQRPDVILVAGDLFQGDAAQRRAVRPALRELLGRLHARGGVYAVQGDAELHTDLADLLVGTDVRVLEDAAVERTIGDRRVLIGGNRLRWAPDVARALRQQLMDADPSVVRILLAHRPDVVLALPTDAAIDLTVAGHTHGGQVALPIYGPLVTFSSVPRSVAAGGLHEVAGNRIYVSTGVGLVRQQAPQVRLGARPSVGLVVLR